MILNKEAVRNFSLLTHAMPADRLFTVHLNWITFLQLLSIMKALRRSQYFFLFYTASGQQNGLNQENIDYLTYLAYRCLIFSPYALLWTPHNFPLCKRQNMNRSRFFKHTPSPDHFTIRINCVLMFVLVQLNSFQIRFSLIIYYFYPYINMFFNDLFY